MKKNFNFAYKCFYFDEGIIFVFNDITSFKENEINVRVAGGEIFVEFGQNVALLSEKAIEHLKNTGKVFLTKCKVEEYEDNGYQYAFEVDKMLLAKLEGAAMVLKNMPLHEVEQQNQSTTINKELSPDEEKASASVQ